MCVRVHRKRAREKRGGGKKHAREKSSLLKKKVSKEKDQLFNFHRGG